MYFYEIESDKYFYRLFTYSILVIYSATNLKKYEYANIFKLLSFEDFTVHKNFYQFLAVYFIGLLPVSLMSFLKLTNLRYVDSSDDTVF